MSNEAQTPEHGDFTDYGARYLADQAKKGGASPPAPAPPPSPLPPIPAPPKPAEAPTEPVPVAVAAEPSIPPFQTLDDLKELERFRLGIWLTKVIVFATLVILFGLLGIYTWIAATTKTLPDMGVLGTIFGHLKEVIVIIIDAQKS